MERQRTRVQRRPVHGVLLLDKPLGFSSNQALQKAKWLLRAEKAGHTGKHAGDDEQQNCNAHVHAFGHVGIGLAKTGGASESGWAPRQENQGRNRRPAKRSQAVHK